MFKDVSALVRRMETGPTVQGWEWLCSKHLDYKVHAGDPVGALEDFSVLCRLAKGFLFRTKTG